MVVESDSEDDLDEEDNAFVQIPDRTEAEDDSSDEYCTVLYCTVLYCTVLVLYCTVMYCTVLYCTVLYCTVL
jgi:hypothetical protein